MEDDKNLNPRSSGEPGLNIIRNACTALSALAVSVDTTPALHSKNNNFTWIMKGCGNKDADTLSFNHFSSEERNQKYNWLRMSDLQNQCGHITGGDRRDASCTRQELHPQGSKA
jgi:hypothetical protein